MSRRNVFFFFFQVNTKVMFDSQVSLFKEIKITVIFIYSLFMSYFLQTVTMTIAVFDDYFFNTMRYKTSKNVWHYLSQRRIVKKILHVRWIHDTFKTFCLWYGEKHVISCIFQQKNTTVVLRIKFWLTFNNRTSYEIRM